MRRHKNYHSNTAFLDLLFNCFLAFVALFAIAIANFNMTKKTKNVEAKADFIITVTWPQEFNDDIDTYLEDPNGGLVFFSRKEDGLMHLDRDDYGTSNDVIQTRFGPVSYKENREIVTLRGTMRGEYVLNVHVYRRGEEENKEKIPVTIQIDKITPFSTVLIKTVHLEKTGDQETVCRFILSEKGEVMDMNTIPKLIQDMATGGVPTTGSTDDDYNEYED